MPMPMTSISAVGAQRQQRSETKAADRYLWFGQFQVDLQREELFKEGLRVRIPSKVFPVLLAPVERPGEIVTREAWRARLGPDGTFANYDANVNPTVNKFGWRPEIRRESRCRSKPYLGRDIASRGPSSGSMNCGRAPAC
jgi:hypothetical protein